jgi:hypothetical protein
MSDSLIIHDKLHSPFFICLRVNGAVDDGSLLKHFHLNAYTQSNEHSVLRHYAIITENDDWTFLADDWYYTLWHMPTTRPALELLSLQYELFACSVGESDRSYDFIYFREGELIRELVVQDPTFQGGQVVKSLGTPFEFEIPQCELNLDEWDYVLSIANSLGIDTRFNERDLRIYSPQ